MCKVSIIVPSYNVAPYITECMDSLIHQTLRDIEIICVDAESVDGTREILEEYAKKDQRVKLLNDKKHSSGYAKNIGIKAARGAYVGIVESDDYVDVTMFERLYEYAVKYNTDIVKGNYKAFTGNGENRIYAWKAVSLDKRDYNRVIDLQESSRYFKWDTYTWTGIYKKSFLLENNILHQETPGAAFQDEGFWMQTFAFAKSAYLVPEYFYHYRKDNPYSSVNQINKVYEMPEEYKFGKSCIEKNSGLTQRVLEGIYRGMYRSYTFIYGILNERYRPEFVRRFYRDISEGFLENAVNRELFTEEEWTEVQMLKDSAEAYEAYQQSIRDAKRKNQHDLLEKIEKYEKNIIFGAGSDGTNLQAYLKERNQDRTVAFCDNSREKWGLSLNNIVVIRPEEIRKQGKILIIVASKLYSRQIQEQILGLGVEEERIYVCNVGATIPSYL